MIARDGDRYRLDGQVVMGNAHALLEEGAQIFNHGEILVDLSGVTEVDSAAVSVMLAWLREAARRKQTLRFENIPPNLKSLVALYGVSEFIPQG